MSRYLMAVYGPAESTENFGYPTREDMQQSLADTHAFNEGLRRDGYWVFADGLDAAVLSTVVDGQGEKVLITDGPYAETKEYLNGFWVIDVPDLDVALRLAAEASKACRGKVEVRPFQTGLPE